jgi:hypothetical protein
MKANTLARALLILLATIGQMPAQQPVSGEKTDTGAKDVRAEAQRRYEQDARTNHITLDKPQYAKA